LAKMMNFGVVFVINAELASGKPFFRSETLIQFNEGNEDFVCAEDQAGFNLFR